MTLSLVRPSLRRTVLAAAFAVIAFVAPAADPVANLVPADSQVYVSVNARQIIDSALFKKLYSEKTTEQQRAQLQVLNGVVGMDVLKDLDRIHAWGLANNEESFCAAVDGRFDQAKLVTLVKANAGFQQLTEGDTTVYRWIDEDEGAERFGAFVSSDRLVIGNSLDALKKSLAAKRNAKFSVASSSSADKFSAPPEQSFYAFMIAPENLQTPGDFEGLSDLSTATIKGLFSELGLESDSKLEMKSAESAKNLNDMINGLVALARMQGDEPQVKELLKGVSVNTPADSNTVSVSVKLPQALLLELVNQATVDTDEDGGAGLHMEIEASGTNEKPAAEEKSPATGAK